MAEVPQAPLPWSNKKDDYELKDVIGRFNSYFP